MPFSFAESTYVGQTFRTLRNRTSRAKWIDLRTIWCWIICVRRLMLWNEGKNRSRKQVIKLAQAWEDHQIKFRVASHATNCEGSVHKSRRDAKVKNTVCSMNDHTRRLLDSQVRNSKLDSCQHCLLPPIVCVDLKPGRGVDCPSPTLHPLCHGSQAFSQRDPVERCFPQTLNEGTQPARKQRSQSLTTRNWEYLAMRFDGSKVLHDGWFCCLSRSLFAIQCDPS